MAGITQKSWVALFPSWSLKKRWWGILIQNNRKYMKSSKIEVDIVSNTDILLMLLLIIIIMRIILLLVLLLLLLPLIIVIITIIIIEILQLRAKFQATLVSCSRFTWIKNSSDHSRV